MFEKFLSLASALLQAAPAPPPAPPMPDVPAAPLHPFYPLSLEFTDYTANDWGVAEMLTVFLGGWAVTLGVTWVAVSRYAPKLKRVDKWALMWFVLTASIHFFFEGYFSINHARMASRQDLFGQLWKEYAMSDSRYLTADAFVLCMETTTAFLWGPLAYLTVYYILTDHPLRYTVQMIVCMGQLYGLLLYYFTALFDLYHKNVAYCRPEGYYFWFYYFFMNFIWVIFPGILMTQSIVKITDAFRALKSINDSLHSNGHVVKPLANGNANGTAVKSSANGRANGHAKSA